MKCSAFLFQRHPAVAHIFKVTVICYPTNENLFFVERKNTKELILTISVCCRCCFVTEVYKDKIEGGEDQEKYGQEVRKAIRLSRIRVSRVKKNRLKLSERAKDKRFNYFHYP